MSDKANTSNPFSWAPSQYWDGNAGSWSSFVIQIGTPPQDFNIFPSTNGQQTWVPLPQGCTSSDPNNCGDLRGVQWFQGSPSTGLQTNMSSTWVSNGLFTLDVENGLKVSGNGEFGFDTVGLGIQNSIGPILKHQVVAGVSTKDIYLGEFGLGPKPANFSGYDNPIPSYMMTLANQKLIPSLSFGYTAGAKYRLNGVYGNLTLGGFDAARFVSNDLIFPFAADDSRDLTVGLQSVTASNTLEGTSALMTAGAYFLIDSSVPDMWFPLSVCQSFEQAFGLTWDNSTDLYLVNASVHDKLQRLDPILTFKLGVSTLEGATVEITLPYGAFDLQASSPFYSNATNYFPIRRAANSTQFTLGRTFLQEAYIVVDYGHLNFSVNQALFLESFPQQLVAIDLLDRSTSDTGNSSSTVVDHSLRRGTMVGTVIGSAVFVSAVIIFIVLFCRKRRKLRGKTSAPGKPKIEEVLEDQSYPTAAPRPQHENMLQSARDLEDRESRESGSELDWAADRNDRPRAYTEGTSPEQIDFTGGRSVDERPNLDIASSNPISRAISPDALSASTCDSAFRSLPPYNHTDL